MTNFSHLAGKESQDTNSRFPSTGSTSSLSNSATCSSSPVAPSSTNSSVSSRDVPLNGVVLKETRFYKRALTEDIEPTLRLDTAPGLSWLARRTVVNSMSEGSLVVEPMPAAIKHNVFACSLCGENRKDEEYARSHRFRTSENDSAQRYPLCGFCLTRVRASCDFLGFLRMLKDGHWRADDEEGELQAWEECVRLRERMFWARIGGGVVPTFLRTPTTPRDSVEQDHNTSAESDGSLGIVDDGRFTDRADIGLSSIRKENTIDLAATSQDEDRSQPRYEDIGSNVALRPPAQPAEADFEIATAEQPQNDLHGTLSEVRQGLGIENTTPRAQGHVARDSITMPGAFE